MSRENNPRKRDKIHLEGRQIAAIRRAKELSRLLASQADLAEKYCQGRTLDQLVDEFFPEPLNSQDTRNIYIRAISVALGELLGEERKKIGLEHITTAAVKRGTEQSQQGKGMFGRSQEQVSADASAAGKVGGRRAHELKAGVHGLSDERRSEIGQKSGTIGGQRVKELKLGVTNLTDEERLAAVRKSHESRGITPFTGYIRTTEFGELDEQGYIQRLKEAPDFSSAGGWKALTDKVNATFQHDRNVAAVQNCYYHSRKRSS